jgi:ribosomal protein S18 acetylase RimI-like enzyme
VSEDLGRLADGDLGHLTDEDLERIGAIVEGSVDLDRAHGQHILDAITAQEGRRRGRAEDLVLEVLRRAHQAGPDDAA